jgi:hypothetical protein
MGGHAYWYFVPYQDDTQAALDALRTREFEAGRYSPVIRYLAFSEPAFSAQKPGKGHKSIKAALAASAEEGTRSILDIASVGDTPDYGVAAPIATDTLHALYGTDKPTRAMVEADMGFLDDVERGKCVYFVVWDEGVPKETFFAGYSYD